MDTPYYTINPHTAKRGKSDAQAVTNAQTGLLQRFRGACPQLYTLPHHMLNPFKPPQQILTDI